MWLDVCKQFELLGFDCESLGLEFRVNEASGIVWMCTCKVQTHPIMPSLMVYMYTYISWDPAQIFIESLKVELLR
jgi:hypothetical protein